jgi:hypothetical protein
MASAKTRTRLLALTKKPVASWKGTGYHSETGVAIAMRRAFRWLKANEGTGNQPPGHIQQKLQLAGRQLTSAA